MKIAKVISIAGWVLISLGVGLYLFQDTAIEEVPPQIDLYSKEKDCLRELIWYEGRGVSYKEKIAILEVALNRYRHRNYPDNICKVIQQPWQFSYKNRIKDNSQIIYPEFQKLSGILEQKAYFEINAIVESRFQNNTILPNIVLPENALYYHLKDMKHKPSWTKSKKISKIHLDKQFKHVYYSYMDNSKGK